MKSAISSPPAPFSCTYSPNLAELLLQLNCTIAFTTYQAGKVVMLSAVDENNLTQLPRNFQKAMGLALHEHQMAVATKQEVIVLGNTPGLAPNYNKASKTYDALYVPRATYYTGEVDLHDMAWGNGGLYAVNTRFSCISLINDEYSFIPYWKPDFITDLEPVDRCHLNGMAMKNGKPKYATALGTTNHEKGWRGNIEHGGVLIDVETNEIVLEGLAMPHSPRLINGELYVLLSATGELIKVDIENRKYEVALTMNGFLRGMAFCGDYLFVGLSKLRKNSSTFRDLPIADKSLRAGIEVIHLPTRTSVGGFTYQSSVEELYDVQIIQGSKHPGILGIDREDHRNAIVTPTDCFWASID